MNSLPDPAPEYRARLDAASEALRRLDRQGAWLANLRGATFVGALAAAGLAVFGRLPKAEGWAAVLGLVAAYVALAVWHDRVLQRERRQRILQSLNERGLARLSGAWRSFPAKGERFAVPEHPYAPDLDVFGQGSLFQLIDESGTRAGEAQLAAWLSQPADAAQVLERQAAIRELAPQLDFRQALVTELLLVSGDKADPSRFLAWAEGPSALDAIRWAQPLAWLLPLAFAATASLWYLDLLSPYAPWGAFLALVAAVAGTRKALRATYDAIASGEGGFIRYQQAFAALERHPFQAPALTALAARLHAGGGAPSRVLRAFSRRYSFAELRQSGQLHGAVHLFTLWDVHWLFALERWRKRHGASLRPWFDVLARLEALLSLAGFSHARPAFTFPVVAEGAPRLEAMGLGHPLLDAPVKNDVALPEPGCSLIVTGSNMAGKTTLLRALGANAVLALAGAPVGADALRLTVLDVLTGMRVKDSLERGVSYFYAEVQRLKMVLDRARAAKGRALFLLDEVLLGTNARERQIASREILRLLLETGAIGAVATHDLTLATLEPGEAKVRNVHFEDQIDGEQMTFDYRLREGVVRGTNALRVLQQAGIAVRTPDDA